MGINLWKWLEIAIETIGGEKKKKEKKAQRGRNLYWVVMNLHCICHQSIYYLASAIWFFTLCVLEISYHHQWEQSQNLGICWATSGFVWGKEIWRGRSRRRRSVWFHSKIFFFGGGEDLQKGRWSFQVKNLHISIQ